MLGQLKSPGEWEELKLQFQSAYPELGGGDLSKAVRERLTDNEIGKCSAALAGKGVTLDSVSSSSRASQQGKQLYRALTGQDSSSRVAEVLGQLKSPGEWEELKLQFQSAYPELGGGDLSKAVRERLTDNEIGKCSAALAGKGVTLDSVSSSSRASQQGKQLYRALTGQDSSSRVAEVLGQLKSPGEWEELKLQFQSAYPELGGGDLSKAVRERLTDNEIGKCSAALAGKGVTLDSVSSSSRASQQGKQLYRALTGQDSSSRVAEVLGQLKSPGEWEELKLQFQSAYPELGGGDLSKAVRERLTDNEIGKCSAALAGKGVTLDSVSSSSRASQQGKQLYRALTGQDSSSRVAEVLGQLKSPGEWEELKLQFQSAYPELGGGDLSKAVRERLTDNEIGKCSAALAGKGVTLDSVSSSSRASQQGKQLYRALTGQDSSSRVAEVLGQLKSPGEWEELKLQFQSAYPELGGGDLSKAVRERLTDNEIGKCSAALAGKGVTLDSVSSSSRASQQGKQLYRALTGQDSSSRVAEVLGQLKSPGEWEELKLQFQSAYPELGGGDLSKAVRERLTDNEIGKCSAALAGKGVTLDSVSSSSRASQQGKQLYRALTGQDSSSRVAEVLGQLKSPGEWEELKLQFQSAYPELGGGDLSKAVRERLTDNEIGKCSAALAGKGVTLESASTSSRASQQGKQLYRALTGQDSSSRVAEVLSELKSPGDWEELKLQFRSAYPDLCGGDLSRAVSERAGSHVQECADVLEKNGLSLDLGGYPELIDPGFQADTVYRALTGQDDVARVFDVIAQLESPENWEELKTQFRRSYPECSYGDLARAIRGRMNEKDAEKVADALAARGLRLDGVVRKGDPAKQARTLYRALTEQEDYSRAFGVVNEIRGHEDWAALQRQFYLTYPEIHGGDLTKALCERMGDRDMARFTRALAARGISLGGGSNESALAEKAHTLFNALTGREDTSRVAEVLSQVQSPEEWEELKAEFRREQPQLREGNLLQVLTDRLSDEELERCRGALAGRGISLEGSSQHTAGTNAPTRRAKQANTVFKALTGREETSRVAEVLSQMQSPEEWEELKAEFRREQPQLREGNLLQVLTDRLSDAELERCRGALADRGISLEGHARHTPGTNAPSTLSEQANTVFKALTGQEATSHIVDVLRQLQGPEEWERLQQEFSSAHPQLSGGDLSQALASRLRDEDLRACARTLARHGVALRGCDDDDDEDGGGGCAADASPSPSRGRRELTAAASRRRLGSVGNGGGAHVAEELHRALTSQDGDLAVAILETVGSAEEWADVLRAFRRAYPDFHGGDLSRAIRAKLGKTAAARCTRALARQGIAGSDAAAGLRARSPSPSATGGGGGARKPKAARQAEALQRVLTGVEDASALWRVIGQVETADEWANLQREFVGLCPEFGGGLPAALRAKLGEKQVAQVAEVLRRKGVALDDAKLAPTGDCSTLPSPRGYSSSPARHAESPRRGQFVSPGAGGGGATTAAGVGVSMDGDGEEGAVIVGTAASPARRYSAASASSANELRRIEEAERALEAKAAAVAQGAGVLVATGEQTSAMRRAERAREAAHNNKMAALARRDGELAVAEGLVRTREVDTARREREVNAREKDVEVRSEAVLQQARSIGGGSVVGGSGVFGLTSPVSPAAEDLGTFSHMSGSVSELLTPPHTPGGGVLQLPPHLLKKREATLRYKERCLDDHDGMLQEKFETQLQSLRMRESALQVRELSCREVEARLEAMSKEYAMLPAEREKLREAMRLLQAREAEFSAKEVCKTVEAFFFRWSQSSRSRQIQISLQPPNRPFSSRRRHTSRRWARSTRYVSEWRSPTPPEDTHTQHNTKQHAERGDATGGGPRDKGRPARARRAACRGRGRGCRPRRRRQSRGCGVGGVHPPRARAGGGHQRLTAPQRGAGRRPARAGAGARAAASGARRVGGRAGGGAGGAGGGGQRAVRGRGAEGSRARGEGADAARA